MEMLLGGRKTETCLNNESVLSAWYDAYGTDILRYCFMMLGNRTDAEDATQETFLKAWRNMGRYETRNGCSPKSWIIKIAGNTCRDYLRKAWHRYECRLITPEDLKKLGNAPDESRELIMDVMNLPTKYREVVLLVFMQGMTVREAAACMQTSASTISRRLEKAKKMIA